ncbi:hypothetical protein Cni_G23361 [Canna indica]|uniref:Reverse transcriptase zinc-binding domain-containing protein n=1 Tax=Canna indica TaxID=4628 RepID=A0AAQ3QMC1_9LILI|nr:hypothetical protein Cni_G23361 [Canna indica]
MKVSERVKLFIWKVLWGRLPTSWWNAKLSGIEANKCHICNEGIDDMNHILFDCKYAKVYWKMAEETIGIVFSFKNEWRQGEWLKEADGFEEVSAVRLKLFWQFQCGVSGRIETAKILKRKVGKLEAY